MVPDLRKKRVRKRLTIRRLTNSKDTARDKEERNVVETLKIVLRKETSLIITDHVEEILDAALIRQKGR